MTAALEGTRVVELGWAAAGPLVGTYLAQHGADVIHVESSTALDPFRSTYPPFRDNVVGPDRAGMFAFYNAGKRGVTLDLKQPRGVELALRLVTTADVVIESFPAGTLARRGLGHDALPRARAPRARGERHRADTRCRPRPRGRPARRLSDPGRRPLGRALGLERRRVVAVSCRARRSRVVARRRARDHGGAPRARGRAR